MLFYFFRNNYLHLEVYFTELSETKITQHQSYSFFDLTCKLIYLFTAPFLCCEL